MYKIYTMKMVWCGEKRIVSRQYFDCNAKKSSSNNSDKVLGDWCFLGETLASKVPDIRNAGQTGCLSQKLLAHMIRYHAGPQFLAPQRFSHRRVPSNLPPRR